jgi:hypothetical protein
MVTVEACEQTHSPLIASAIPLRQQLQQLLDIFEPPQAADAK